MQGSEAATATDKVGIGEKIAYGLGNFGTQMIFNPATSFMVFFYTDIAGIAAATVGNLLFVSRLFDLLNPLMGMVVDKTKSRHGKARPWLLWLAIPFGLSGVLLFSTPHLGPTGKIIYAFVTYNLAFTVIYTVIDVPYSALLPLITPDQHQRTLLNVSRMSLANCGMILSYAVTLPLVKVLGGGATGWQRAFWIFGAAGSLLLLICFSATRERVISATDQQSRSVPVKAAMGALLRNPHWILLAVFGGLLFITLGLYGANIYFCRYFLGNQNLFGLLMTTMIAVQVLGMIVTPSLTKRFGKRKTAMGGTLIAIAGQCLMFVGPTSFAIVMTGTVIKALGAAPCVGTMFAMIADTVDFGEWKFGIRTDGLAYGALALVLKSCVGFGNVLVGWILAWGGYVAGAAVQTTSALFAIKAMFLHLPLVIFVLTLVVLGMYRLDSQYSVIAADLKRRRMGDDQQH
jgi:GPH family glycoside/pentoside/hexuronide:cation symporter